MNPTPEEFEQFEKEAWRPFAESYAPTLSSERRYSDMLRGWLIAHRSSQVEVERLRDAAGQLLRAAESTFRDGPSKTGAPLFDGIKAVRAALATTPADSNGSR